METTAPTEEAPATKKPIEWTFRERLRKARENTGMNQREFAAALGVGRTTVVNWEKGKGEHARSALVLREWARLGDVPLDWLRDGESDTVTVTGGYLVVIDGMPNQRDASRELALLGSSPSFSLKPAA